MLGNHKNVNLCHLNIYTSIDEICIDGPYIFKNLTRQLLNCAVDRTLIGCTCYSAAMSLDDLIFTGRKIVVTNGPSMYTVSMYTNDLLFYVHGKLNSQLDSIFIEFS